tara:strand:+ start:5934 stop:6188 length:255 start_codon:yes stop_codon:yes gene_type:complete
MLVKATPPSQYDIGKVALGDIVRPNDDYYVARRFFGELNVVVWIPNDYVAFTKIHYIDKNDWIMVYSIKTQQQWKLKFGEYEIV